MKRASMLLCAAAFAAFCAGCDRPPKPKTASSGASATPAAAQEQGKSAGQRVGEAAAKAKPSASDAALTAKVKAALANEAALKTAKIDVDSNGGVVSLKGQVESDETKQRIHEVAKAVPGVTWVQNQISVAPVPQQKSG